MKILKAERFLKFGELFFAFCFSTYIMMTPRVFYRVIFGSEIGDIVGCVILAIIGMLLLKRKITFSNAVITFSIYLLFTLVYMVREFSDPRVLVQVFIPLALMFFLYAVGMKIDFFKKMFQISLIFHLLAIILPFDFIINGLDRNTLFGISSWLSERETGFFEAPAMLGLYSLMGLAIFSYLFLKEGRHGDLIWGVLFSFVGFSTLNRSFVLGYILFIFLYLWISKSMLSRAVIMILSSCMIVVFVPVKTGVSSKTGYLRYIVERFKGEEITYGINVRIKGEAGSLRCARQVFVNPLYPNLLVDPKFNRVRLVDSSGYFDCSNGILSIITKRGIITGLIFLSLWGVALRSRILQRERSSVFLLTSLSVTLLVFIDPLLDMPVIFLLLFFAKDDSFWNSAL